MTVGPPITRQIWHQGNLYLVTEDDYERIRKMIGKKRSDEIEEKGFYLGRQTSEEEMQGIASYWDNCNEEFKETEPIRKEAKDNITISVYMDFGVVYEYECAPIILRSSLKIGYTT